jgi:hypothetical protein
MEWIMCRLAEEHGSGPDVVEALANRFDAANGASFCHDHEFGWNLEPLSLWRMLSCQCVE